MDYKMEDLVLLNMRRIKKIQANPQYTGGNKVFEIENTLTLDEKIVFIDNQANGIATYLLNLFNVWIAEKNTLPKDQYGHPKTVSLKAWLKRNDTRNAIDQKYKYGTYYLFRTSYKVMALECPPTEYGHAMAHTGTHIVNQWFHDLLKDLKQKEVQYFKNNDPVMIKLQLVRQFGQTYHIEFNSIEVNDIIWNGKEDVPEDRLDMYLNAYEQIEAEIKRVQNELHSKLKLELII